MAVHYKLADFIILNSVSNNFQTYALEHRMHACMHACIVKIVITVDPGLI